MYCKDCKYFGKEVMLYNDDNCLEDIPTGYHACEIIKHDKEWEYLAGQGATVEDGSGYHAAIRVERDLGCIKWVSKEID